MKSVKEYAKSHRISYEAVRKQIARYENELSGHIIKKNRTRYLDDFAVAFLDERRNSSPIINLSEEVKEESIKNDALQEENKQLLYKIAQLQEQLLEAEKEKRKGIEASAKLQLLEESQSKLEAKNEELTTKVAQLEAEKATFVRTIFGLYKKKPLSVK